MRSVDLKRILRDLNARPTRAAVGRDELSERLAARHATMTETRRSPFMNILLQKPVLAVLVIAVIGVGACTVPTETEVEMGQRLTYTLSPGDNTYDQATKLLDQVSDIDKYIASYPGVESLGVSINEIDGGPVSVDLIVWGTGFDAGTLQSNLARRWPVLTGTKLEATELTGTVKTSLAEKIGHNLFEIDVLDGTSEEMQAQILEQIYESGFDGEANVQVTRDGDMVTIDLEMVQEGEGLQTEDELIIEIKSRDD